MLFELRQSELYKLVVYILSIILLLSCTFEENQLAVETENTFISFEGLKLRSGSTHQGDAEDYIVQTFRILAFDGSGQCVSNTHYNAMQNEIIQLPIDLGIYTFVFLANEPNIVSIKTQLDNISAYTDLDGVAYPESSFLSNVLIPMMQEIKNVEILTGGAAKINGTSVSTPIKLELDRVGARVDVTLKAVEDLDAIFTGVTFSNIPDKVPLTANYAGTINRNVTRTFTLAANSEYFSDTTVVESGIVWAKRVARIITPSNEFSPTSDKTKAVVFTVNLDGKYNPYCELKIGTNDYTVPRNTKLDLLGTVKMPLDMNIKASPWVESNNTWTPDNRILNVSQIEAEITDFNGVRISFSSNMPKVRILPEVYVGDIGTVTDVTNNIFNDLAITDGTDNTTRFSYNPVTGSGYMDVLVDGINSPGNYTYRLILSAEDGNGNNQLQREIKIKITQNGTRPKFDPWGYRYSGAFFRNNEQGERVITGQHSTNYKWIATVISGSDFITISSTPSFDPDIGTNKPGDPELFPVTENIYKNENGISVQGKGRVYFRIGTKSTNTGMPRYGLIEVKHHPTDTDWEKADYIYIRQGEEADYIWRPQDVIPDDTLRGQNRTAARKFSPYNITAQAFKNGNTQFYQQLNVNGAVFVDYPSQTGAYFQWGISKNAPGTIFEENIRRAYHPTVTVNPSDLGSDYFTSAPIWDPPSGYAYKTDCEVCPPGYYRPSDGYTDRKAFNGPYNIFLDTLDVEGDYSEEIAYSNLRVSLLEIPLTGNGYKDGVPPTHPVLGNLYGTLPAYYADGFFDRRPIVMDMKAVSINNANIAFRGTLFFNPNNNASVFLPSAGRLESVEGRKYAGDTGYYWSSSVAPRYPKLKYGVWGFETGYWNLAPVTSVGSFGFSIRCVTD